MSAPKIQVYTKWGTPYDGITTPATSTDNAAVRWDGTTGQAIQDSPLIISDAGVITGVTANANIINAGELVIAQGGTGQATALAAINALSPLTTKGDLLVHTGINNVRQGVGTDEDSVVADAAQTNGVKYAKRLYQIYENGASVVSPASRLDFIDLNVDNPSLGIAAVYKNNSAPAGGRLTLTSATPVTTSDVSGGSAVTIYYTPYLHDEIAIQNASGNLVDYHFIQAQLSLSGFTTTQPYDIFGFNTAGVLTLEAEAWSSNTARNINITRLNGYWGKVGNSTRRYLGTIKMQATSQCEDSVLRRFVFNADNRIERDLWVFDTANTWSYATATWRAANANNSNRVEVVLGLSQEPVYLNHQFMMAGGTGYAGICLDNTTQNDARTKQGFLNPIAASGIYNQPVAIGYHFLQMVEKGAASVTFYGDNNTPSDIQNGMIGHVWA